MVAVAQFWAFANDVYTSERGRRLFPLVGVGATLGAALGSLLATLVFGGIGPYVLMLIAAVGLLVPVILTIVVNRRENASQAESRTVSEQPLAKGNGFKLVLGNRYLLLIALMVLVFNLVNTLGGFMLNDLITQEADSRIAAGLAPESERRDIIATLSGTVLTSVNILAFVLQTFAVSRIFKVIGVRGALFVLPLIALGGYTAVMVVPMLLVLQWTKILENSTDYSIQNTTRHALFLPTSREAKYNAKQAIDAFFVRTGDLLQAGVVFVGTELLALTVRSFALVNVVLVGVWLALAVGIAREHRKLVGSERSTEKAA
jgi:AAA family ATP:ADP antiporter